MATITTAQPQHRSNHGYPRRLLRLLNYLGLLNMIGIILIVATEQQSDHHYNNLLPTTTTTMCSHHSRPPGGDHGVTFTGRSSSSSLSLRSLGKNITLARLTRLLRKNSNPHNSSSSSSLQELEQENKNDVHDDDDDNKDWIDDATKSRLPPWSSVVNQYGPKPIVWGLDQCAGFRWKNRHGLNQIVIGPAGMFNSGTNLLSRLLQANCVFANRPERLYYHGRAFQVPWGKHTPAQYRHRHTIPHPLYQTMILDAVLPVVTIRHPYDWMKSTCQQPYAIHWGESVQRIPNHHNHNGSTTPTTAAFRRTAPCPELVNRRNETQTALVTYRVGNHTYETIAHLWNEWYRAYYNTMAFSRLVVRLEDLIFYPQETIQQICHCAGGNMTQPFTVPLESTKAGATGHSNQGTNYLEATIRYGRPRTYDSFPPHDLTAARHILDRELMSVFGYSHP